MEQEVTVDGYVCKRVGVLGFYSPELIEHKKQSYNHFSSLPYHPFSPIESQEFIEVNMGEIKTAVTGEAKILHTKPEYRIRNLEKRRINGSFLVIRTLKMLK